MLLLAIDLYGIQPFQKPTRITLKPNLNIISGANGAGKTTVFHILSALLLNKSLQEVTFLENHPAQAAVIFQARDGGTYRIAADFLKSVLNLSKIDPTGKGTLIEKDREKIRAWVQKEVSGLEDTEIASLFMIDRPRLPSMRLLRNGNSLLPSAPASASPPLHPNRPSGPAIPSDRKEKEKKLKEAQQRFEEISQYEHESLMIRDKASEVRHRIEEIEALGLQIQKLEETGAKKFLPLAGIEKIPADLLKRYEEGLQNKQKELSQLEDDKIEVENQIVGVGIPDPFKDRPLQIGIGVLAFSLLLPIVITLQGPFRYLFPVGILVGIGMTAKAYIHLNRQTSTRDELQRKRSSLNEKTHQIDKKFEKEHKELLDLTKKTGVKDIQDLKGLQRAYQNHLRNLQESVARKQTLLKGETIEDLEAQRQELEKKAKTYEEKLRENEGLTQEIYRLQDDLRNSPDAAEPAMDLESSLPAFSVPADRLLLSPESPTPSPLFLSQALAIGKRHGAALPLDQIQKQADILSSLFSPDKKREIHLNELGEVKLGQVGTDQLSSGTADQIFLCVALSTWDRFTGVPFPLVLDDPLISIDPTHQEIALELLRGVSKKRQVLLFTVSPFAGSNGDHRIQL